MAYMATKYTGCFGRTEIENFKPPENSVLICIYDPGESYPKVGRMIQGWRFISFHDFWDTEPQKPDRVRFPGLATMMPAATPEEIACIKDTIDTFHNGYNIFVSCEAGISRSGAVREFLLRRGYQFLDESQKRRPVPPKAFILAALET